MMGCMILAFGLGLLLLGSLLGAALTTPPFHYAKDAWLALGILVLLFSLRKSLRLTAIGLVFVVLSLAAHLLGVFGFYDQSPLPTTYDQFTNFVGSIASAWIAYDLLKGQFKGSFINSLYLIVLVVSISAGITSLVHAIEYWGFSLYGGGDGLFRFGGLGDTTQPTPIIYTQQSLAGAWTNQALDRQAGFMGAFSVVFVRTLASTISKRFA